MPDEPVEPVEPRKFKTGAKPTPRYKLLTARPYRAIGVTPPQVIVIPPFLEAWLNDQYGDCVSAEECFAKAAYSVMNGLPETKITDATLMAFCRKYDLLNGAELPQVMDLMISDGFHQDGTTYNDGHYTGVDFSNESILQNAISKGPVKIGISSSSLPSGAGNHNGWYAFGGHGGAQDHCVALSGYGPCSALFQALGVQVPNNAPANGYLLYTWGTIGVVDHAWLMAACGEAWLRDPTTPGITPVPPAPGPTPLHQVVVIPTQTGYITGLPFLHVTVPGGTYPVTSAPALMATPEAIPWSLLLMILRQGIAYVCANPGVFGPALQPIISQICGFIPRGQGGCK